MTTKKRIILILNAKGGVGKSFFAINLVQYLKDQNLAHVAIDTDNANSTLKRAHPDALFVNVDKRQELDAVFTSLDVQPLVVVDGRAASTDLFLTYFDEIELADLLKKLKASLTVVIPVSHEANTVAQVKLLSDVLGARCDYLIVKNQGLTEDFRIYDGSQARKRVLEELKGKEIVMPPLYDWLVARLNAENLTVSQASQSEKITIIDRQRLINWQRRFFEQLQSAKELLLV
jgi:cellulose biosynthesis protein BcsQ